MAQITVEELYSGEKYGLMNKVVADYMKHGRPAQIPEETWLDMLLIKHTVAAIEEMKKEGDSISTMFDGESSSAYVGWDDDNTWRFILRKHSSVGTASKKGKP